MARPSPRSRRHTLFATAALALLAAAPLALASQGTLSDSQAKKKKGTKATPSASASASAAPAEEPTPAPSAAPPAPESTAAPTETTTPPEAGTASVEDVRQSNSYVRENPGYTYIFIGARYRMNLIPAFLEHLFVRDGADIIVSSSIGAEIEFRKNQASIIPWLQYTEYGFGDTLFLQKGVPDQPNNYTIVNSQLKAIYAGVDLLWASKLDKAEHWAIDYGFGAGIGAIFGNLYNDWAWSPSLTPGSQAPANVIHADNHNTYAKCISQFDNPSCTTAAHQNATVAKVGNYVEPNWFNGGAVPVVFLHLAGQVGVRWKPIKQVQVRLTGGIQLTGFMLGLSADYGLTPAQEQNDTSPAVPPAKENTPGSGTSSADKN